MAEIYYREVNARWSNERLAISVEELHVVRRTPKGCWVISAYWYGRGDYPKHLEKFILDGAGKRYAYPTREAARASFIIRKEREIVHCAAQLERAERYLALAKTGEFGTRTEALHELRTPTEMLLENLAAPAIH